MELTAISRTGLKIEIVQSIRSLAALNICEYLAAVKKPLSQSYLQAHFGFTNKTVKKAIQYLFELGYVEPVPLAQIVKYKASKRTYR